MEKFQFVKTEFDGLVLIEPTVYCDNRGYFMETYNRKDFLKAGIAADFVQQNQSKSKKGVLRGLHFQTKKQQAKLVRVLFGEVFDVAVDLRKDSKTFGNWYGTFLSSENKRMLYIPQGFAHGFLVLSSQAEFLYDCTEFYAPQYESGILWNDADLAINWPITADMKLILSAKDQNQPSFQDYIKTSELSS